MRRLGSILAFAVPTAVAVIALMANQPADEAGRNIRSFVSSPLLSSVVIWFYGLFSTRLFLAISSFIVGCVATVLFVRWRANKGKLSPLEVLATEVSLAGYSLDNMSGIRANSATIANLNIVMNKLQQRGYVMPPVQSGAWDKDRMSYYLHQVAAYLKHGHEPAAKNAAQNIVTDWDKS